MDPADRTTEPASLPVDDGRGPGEEWPWRRSEDYGVQGGAGRLARRFLLLTLAGSVAALVVSAPGPVYAAIAAVAALLVCIELRAAAPDSWADWRIRNLEAAEFRADCCLTRVDPEFAREMGWMVPGYGPGEERPGGVPMGAPPLGGSGTAGRIPWERTTGPTVPWSYPPGSADDDLPF